jgi:hypothetical protein
MGDVLAGIATALSMIFVYAVVIYVFRDQFFQLTDAFADTLQGIATELNPRERERKRLQENIERLERELKIGRNDSRYAIIGDNGPEDVIPFHMINEDAIETIGRTGISMQDAAERITDVFNRRETQRLRDENRILRERLEVMRTQNELMISLLQRTFERNAE